METMLWLVVYCLVSKKMTDINRHGPGNLESGLLHMKNRSASQSGDLQFKMNLLSKITYNGKPVVRLLKNLETLLNNFWDHNWI